MFNNHCLPPFQVFCQFFLHWKSNLDNRLPRLSGGPFTQDNNFSPTKPFPVYVHVLALFFHFSEMYSPTVPLNDHERRFSTGSSDRFERSTEAGYRNRVRFKCLCFSSYSDEIIWYLKVGWIALSHPVKTTIYCKMHLEHVLFYYSYLTGSPIALKLKRLLWIHPKNSNMTSAYFSGEQKSLLINWRSWIKSGKK